MELRVELPNGTTLYVTGDKVAIDYLNGIVAEVARLNSLVTEWKEVGDDAKNVMGRLLEDRTALRAEVEKLKAALRVYAGPVGGDNFPHWSDGYPGGVMVEWNTIDFGDAARAALGDTP